MRLKEFKKLKVGDKVKVKYNLVPDKFYGINVFVGEMSKHKGKNVTIDGFDYYHQQISIREDKYYDFLYTPEMLENTFKFGR